MPVNPQEVLDAMNWLDGYYQSAEGLNRSQGVSLDGKPDFEALAAWIFDVFLNSRLSGLDLNTSRQNVARAIQETLEWRQKHPGAAMVPGAPYHAALNFDRRELLQALYRLDVFYKSWNGLQRPNGLSKNGKPDFEGVAVWVFGAYLNARLSGQSPERAWDNVVAQIRGGDEWRSRVRRPVDASTLNGKHLVGYQGWFGTPNDGQNNGWDHWFRGGGATADNANFDLYPDTREFFDSELFDTAMTLKDGRKAGLYSSHHPRTLQRHFDWMADYGIDGVSIGRFINGTKVDHIRQRLDGFLQKLRRAAEASGRVFFIWYDVTDCPGPTFVADMQRDWTYVMEVLRPHDSPSYLRHRGKPVMGIWAAGSGTCPRSPQDWMSLTAWLKTQPQNGATVWLGCSRDWRTDNTWRPVLDTADIVAPWAVTGYLDLASADAYCRDVVVPDIAYTRARGQEYVPLIFPGFSWHNLQQRRPGNPINGIPRLGGQFYWRQAFNAARAGATNLFTAMFDEVDEGTAILKIAPTQRDVPSQGQFLTLDADGQQIPSDWYLRLAGEAARMLRRETAIQEQIPIRP
jgi:hypothetical protein